MKLKTKIRGSIASNRRNNSEEKLHIPEILRTFKPDTADFIQDYKVTDEDKLEFRISDPYFVSLPHQ